LPDIRKAINHWSFPEGTSIGQALALAREAGFWGYEPALSETGPLSLESTDEEILAVRLAADNAGMRLTSLATGLYWQYPFTSPDAAIREKGLDIARFQLRAARLLGVDAVLVVPGAVTKDVGYVDAWERASGALKALAPEAEKQGVVIGVENVWNKFLLSPKEMRDFLDEIGSPWVQAYLDAGNMQLFGYAHDWAKTLGKRIVKVHVKDFRGAVGNMAGFVSLLDGDVDYPAFMDALRATGYDDCIIAEVGPCQAYPEEIVWQTSRAMDRILG